MIQLNPIFGLGAAVFPLIFSASEIHWINHTHNLPIELALSYGLPATLLLFGTISLIILLTGKIILRQNKEDNQEFIYYERAFWTSAFIFLLSQLTDIQYFDGKISIVFWLLIAGLKNMIQQDEYYKD